MESQELIHTTQGDVELRLLTKLEGINETDNEKIMWTEYRFIGQEEIVRRDVHMELKKSVHSSAEGAKF